MSHFIERTLVDASGSDVGKVTDVISDSIDMTPRFLVVRVGRFGSEHLVPMDVIEEHDDHFVATVDKDQVKSAPRIHDHTEPASAEREALYRHYGIAS